MMAYDIIYRAISPFWNLNNQKPSWGRYHHLSRMTRETMMHMRHRVTYHSFILFSLSPPSYFLFNWLNLFLSSLFFLVTFFVFRIINPIFSHKTMPTYLYIHTYIYIYYNNSLSYLIHMFLLPPHTIHNNFFTAKITRHHRIISYLELCLTTYPLPNTTVWNNFLTSASQFTTFII